MQQTIPFNFSLHCKFLQLPLCLRTAYIFLQCLCPKYSSFQSLPPITVLKKNWQMFCPEIIQTFRRKAAVVCFFYKTLLTTMCWFWPIPVAINSAYGNLSIQLLCQLLRCCQSKWPIYWNTKHSIVLGSPIWWTPGPAWRSSKGEPIHMAKQLWCWTVTFKLLPGWQELTYRLGQCLPLDLHLPLKKSFSFPLEAPLQHITTVLLPHWVNLPLLEHTRKSHLMLGQDAVHSNASWLYHILAATSLCFCGGLCMRSAYASGAGESQNKWSWMGASHLASLLLKADYSRLLRALPSQALNISQAQITLLLWSSVSVCGKVRVFFYCFVLVSLFLVLISTMAAYNCCLLAFFYIPLGRVYMYLLGTSLLSSWRPPWFFFLSILQILDLFHSCFLYFSQCCIGLLQQSDSTLTLFSLVQEEI